MRFIWKLLLVLFMGLTSCSNNVDDVVISKDFTNEEWSRFDYLIGDFDVIKSPVKYDIVMEVAVSDIFPDVYENNQDNSTLSVNLTITNPEDSGRRSRDYNFNLKDRDGNWKSEKANGYYVFKLPMIDEMTFSEEGTYQFKLENKYSKDPLYGIKSLTIKCIN